MPTLYSNQSEQSTAVQIDKNKSILLIAKGNTFAINEVRYYDSAKKVLHDYGDTELSQVFALAKEYGAPHVFVLNLVSKTDFIEIAEVIAQHDFAYVVPVNINLSDYFYDGNNQNEKVYYAQDYINRVSVLNSSIFIFTDKHAELFEDIDSYLAHLKEITFQLEARIKSGTNSSNVIHVANNIKRHKHASVALASVLSIANINDYPSMPKEEVIFNIDGFDIKEVATAYFKTHSDGITTIENLVNLERFIKIKKSVYVDRLLKYIERNFDLSKFHGRAYSSHQKILVEKEVETFFSGLQDFILRDYHIHGVYFYKEAIGVGRIECHVDIWPKSTTEVYRVVVK